MKTSSDGAVTGRSYRKRQGTFRQLLRFHFS